MWCARVGASELGWVKQLVRVGVGGSSRASRFGSCRSAFLDYYCGDRGSILYGRACKSQFNNVIILFSHNPLPDG